MQQQEAKGVIKREIVRLKALAQATNRPDSHNNASREEIANTLKEITHRIETAAFWLD